MARYIDLTDQVRGLVEKDAAAVVEAGALIVRDQVVLSMERAGPRSGRIYKIPGTQTEYQASAEGEPPAIRTAQYRSSWLATPAVIEGSVVSSFAFTDLTTKDGRFVLGRLLEEGTRFMGPREHVAKAVEASEVEIRRWLRDFK